MSETETDECWCEYVDIGVGMQKVAENPECPHCVADPIDYVAEFQAQPWVDLSQPAPACVALPNGGGPSCDWDPDCPANH